MTQKALNFIVSGMLTTEKEVTQERIAYILSHMSEDIIDNFVEGFITDVTVVDDAAVEDYLRRVHPGRKELVLENTTTKMEGMVPQLVVKYSYAVYRKKDGKDYDYKDTAQDEYDIKSAREVTTVYENDALLNIPGLKIAIL